MEKILVKTGIYTFIITFSLLLVLMPRTDVVADVSGIYSSIEYTYLEYFLMLLKYSIIVTYIAVIILFLIKYSQKKKSRKGL